MSTFPLPLPGWDDHSVWGWDPGLNCLYAQLWRNGNNPEESDDDPDVWLMPPEIRTLYVEELQAAIVSATGLSVGKVRRAVGQPSEDDLFVSG
jgi:hypothetical protein